MITFKCFSNEIKLVLDSTHIWDRAATEPRPHWWEALSPLRSLLLPAHPGCLEIRFSRASFPFRFPLDTRELVAGSTRHLKYSSTFFMICS